jgi:hypothetical protein
MAKVPSNVLAAPAPVYYAPVIWDGEIDLPLYRVLNAYRNKANNLLRKAGALYQKDSKHPKVKGILEGANQFLVAARRVATLIYSDEAAAQLEAAGVPAVSIG